MLHTTTLCALAALLNLAASQPAPGIALQADPHTLEVTFGTNNVSPPGKMMPRADLLKPPTIRAANLPGSPKGPFVLAMIDSDVPRNNSRVPLLHWLSSNVTLSQNSTLIVPQKQEAPFIAPNPPAGDSPHAYSFLLYTAPASGLSIPAKMNLSSTNARIFSSENALVSFMTAAGIKGKALAANYMEVQNKSAAAGGMTFPPPRAGAAANGTTGGGNGKGGMGNGNMGGNGKGGGKNGTSPVPFTGAANGMGVGGGMWLSVVGTAAVGIAAVML